MNIRELGENIGLEEDEFWEMIELFIETSAADLSKLQSAIDEGNVQDVIEAAHSIKGASVNIGFMEIFELAKGVEMNARNNSLVGAVEVAISMRENLDLLLKEKNMYKLDNYSELMNDVG